MSSACFLEYIQARDAAGLKVYMTNERNLPADHFERNNVALFGAYICGDGADKICEVLISFGADVNSVVNQWTPLFIACRNAHPACVGVLLTHGVNVNARDRNNVTPLMASARKAYTLFGLTLDQFIDNRCQCMRFLLDAGVAIDQTDGDGWTALMHAAWNFRLTEILVEAGATVTILCKYHSSALHIASERNSANVVELMLEGGVYVDGVNVSGRTPLHFACCFLSPASVDSLLLHNADIDIVDNDDLTALQLAMFCSDTHPNRVDVLQLMATCAQTRFEASSADWIRLARSELYRSQIAMGSIGDGARFATPECQ